MGGTPSATGARRRKVRRVAAVPFYSSETDYPSEAFVDPLDKLIVEAECKKLSSSFFHYTDRGKFSSVAELFTEDGVFERFGETLRGRSEIIESMSSRPQSIVIRHGLLNMHFTSVESDTATAYVDVLTVYGVYGVSSDESSVVAQVADSPRVVQFEDLYQNIDGVWRIQRRAAQIILSGRHVRG
ncbi:nuclear transport factor 2 family protein [Rhodococcus wratislaviensis]|uniref:SnoaL-like domain-containing protein n=1 Tax=Rhodococcus wratislaviensis NBRC 100605 TaxID=1219028 RepID=X0PM45_RHOWR|nr:hypothetical protein RW1_009_00180 [Rhodococcus wratislaviensis NBRC 100605]